jgi:hypothetical protein
MLHPIEKLYEPNVPLTSAELQLIYLRSPLAGKVKRFSLWFTSASPAGEAKFDVRVAGVSQFPLLPDMLTINDAGSWFDEIGGLSINVSEGDIILLDCRTLIGGPFITPATFLIEIDDELDYVTGATLSTDGTFASNSDIKVPSEKAAKTYMDGLVVGLLDDRGAYDASGNVYPTTGGSGPAGAIKKGDIWNISVAGTLGGSSVHIGDWIRSLVDTPGSTSGNWAILPKAGISYTDEQAQDAIGTILDNGTVGDINFNYDDPTPKISGTIKGSVALSGIPTAPTAAAGTSTGQIATTSFVANAVLGQNFKEACKYVTVAALPSAVYSNGSSGVGSTLTGVSFGALSIDGSTPSVGDRILVKNQATGFQNGIYVVTTVGAVATLFVLTRATDFNQSFEINSGDSTFIRSGSTESNTTWVYSGNDAPVIGTDVLTFVQTSGSGSTTLHSLTDVDDSAKATGKALVYNSVSGKWEASTVASGATRSSTITSSSSPTPNADTTDIFTVTAQAVGATFGAPTGTPVEGQALLIRIKDNGSTRSLAYNAVYRALGVTLPSATTASKTLYLGMIYNAVDTKWDIIGVNQEA